MNHIDTSELQKGMTALDESDDDNRMLRYLYERAERGDRFAGGIASAAEGRPALLTDYLTVQNAEQLHLLASKSTTMRNGCAQCIDADLTGHAAVWQAVMVIVLEWRDARRGHQAREVEPATAVDPEWAAFVESFGRFSGMVVGPCEPEAE